MMRIKYGMGGYHLTASEIGDIVISIKAIIAALSQPATYQADIDKAAAEAQHILDALGIE